LLYVEHHNVTSDVSLTYRTKLHVIRETCMCVLVS